MKVNSGFRNGYVKAVLDIIRVFEKYGSMMKSHRKMNRGSLIFVQQVLTGFLRYRNTIIDEGIDNMVMLQRPNGEIKFKEKKI